MSSTRVFLGLAIVFSSLLANAGTAPCTASQAQLEGNASLKFAFRGEEIIRGYARGTGPYVKPNIASEYSYSFAVVSQEFEGQASLGTITLKVNVDGSCATPSISTESSHIEKQSSNYTFKDMLDEKSLTAN